MRIKYICIFASSLLYSSLSHSETVPLSKVEQQSIVGGTTVNISTLESGERFGSDEIEIRGAIQRNFFGNATPNTDDIRISQTFGRGKAEFTTISMRSGTSEIGIPFARGSWVLNHVYPLNRTPAPFTLKICTGDQGIRNGNTFLTPACTVTAPGGDLSDIDIDESINVYKIWFHNVIDNNQASFVSNEKLKSLVDWDVNRFVDFGEKNTMDAIYAQCDISERIQFRNDRIDTVDATNWSPTATDFTRPTIRVNDRVNILPDQFSDYTDLVDPNGDFIHVFILNEIRRAPEEEDQSTIAGVANSFRGNMFAIKDDFVNNSTIPRGARLLAHEFGHTQGLFHPRELANASDFLCDDTASSNVMCSSTTGNTITSEQCEIAFRNRANIRDFDTQ